MAQRLARPELAAASQTDPSTLLVVDVRSRRRFARGHAEGGGPGGAGGGEKKIAYKATIWLM